MIGIAKYTAGMAEWLAARGHEVRVVTAPPYYPAWQIGHGYSGAVYQRERSRDVSILRCPIYVPASPGGTRRLLHLLSFAVTSLPAMIWEALTFRPQIVLSIAPAIFSAPVSRLAALSCGASAWLHIQDFEIDVAFELNLLRGNGLRRLALGVESLLLRSFGRVSSISPQMCRKIAAKGVASDRIVEFRNWVNVGDIFPLSGPNDYRQALGLAPDQMLLLYSGNIARKQGLEIVIEAAAALQSQSKLVFLICGDGPGKADLLQESSHLSNVHFLPLQPTERLNELLNAADIHLLPQQAGAADLVLPSKLTGILASGRPVIATAMPETALAQEVAECGMTVPPNDANAFIAAIEVLVGDADRRIRLGAGARMRAEACWGQEMVLERFESQLMHLTSHPIGECV